MANEAFPMQLWFVMLFIAVASSFHAHRVRPRALQPYATLSRNLIEPRQSMHTRKIVCFEPMTVDRPAQSACGKSMTAIGTLIDLPKECEWPVFLRRAWLPWEGATMGRISAATLLRPGSCRDASISTRLLGTLA